MSISRTARTTVDTSRLRPLPTLALSTPDPTKLFTYTAPDADTNTGGRKRRHEPRVTSKDLDKWQSDPLPEYNDDDDDEPSAPEHETTPMLTGYWDLENESQTAKDVKEVHRAYDAFLDDNHLPRQDQHDIDLSYRVREGLSKLHKSLLKAAGASGGNVELSQAIFLLKDNLHILDAFSVTRTDLVDKIKEIKKYVESYSREAK